MPEAAVNLHGTRCVQKVVEVRKLSKKACGTRRDASIRSIRGVDSVVPLMDAALQDTHQSSSHPYIWKAGVTVFDSDGGNSNSHELTDRVFNHLMSVSRACCAALPHRRPGRGDRSFVGSQRREALARSQRQPCGAARSTAHASAQKRLRAGGDNGEPRPGSSGLSNLSREGNIEDVHSPCTWCLLLPFRESVFVVISIDPCTLLFSCPTFDLWRPMNLDLDG